jgi:hypothetical protein
VQCVPLSKFLHRASELVVTHHFVDGINHGCLVFRIHPPGVLINNGMEAHRTDEWIKLRNRFFKLCLCQRDFLLKGVNFTS